MSPPAHQMPAPPANHALSQQQFDGIAYGEGGPEAVRFLLASEHSRRLLLLRALLDLARERPQVLGALPTAEAAWHALIDIYDHAPTVLRSVLLHPQVGSWLSHSLRLGNGVAGASQDSPDWAEFGQVHAVVLAAAMRAGRNLRTRVPVRDGCVLLPTLGLARFPSVRGFTVADAYLSQGICRLRLGGQEISVRPDAPESDTWWGLRRLRSEFGGKTLEVWLDDIDFYRNFAEPVEPSRLDGDAVRTWQRQLDGAWATLCRAHPDTADAMAVGLGSITPLDDDPAWGVRSASTGDAFGAALISPTEDPVILAMTMVHEFQHTRLGGLLHLTTLYHDDDEREYLYAPWRPDPRPLAGLVQGVYAFFGIAEFWRVQRRWGSEHDRRTADFEFALARRQTWLALSELSRSPGLTELGANLVDGLRSRLRPWLAEHVPPRQACAAWLAAADHLASWRIRHVAADPVWVARSADAWQDRRHRPPAIGTDRSIRTGGPLWTHSRLLLYRLRLANPNRSREPAVPGVTKADVALLDGDAGTAIEGYLALIEADATDLYAWTGLGLASAIQGHTPVWRVLLRRPELVHALYQEIVRRREQPSPPDVARWVGRAASVTTEADRCRSRPEYSPER